MQEIQEDEEAGGIAEILNGETVAHSYYATCVSSKTLAGQSKLSMPNQ